MAVLKLDENTCVFKCRLNVAVMSQCRIAEGNEFQIDGAATLQTPLRYAGRRKVRSWSQTGPKLVADLLARASSLLAS